jgi:hypothetical protein
MLSWDKQYSLLGHFWKENEKKLEDYITVGWEGFPGTNSIANWDIFRKKMKSCETV